MLFLYGDESKNPTDLIFSIGFIITRKPETHIKIIREIRELYGFTSRELKYDSTDYSQVLPALKLLNYFFKTKDLVFKLIIKDRELFSYEYYKNNKFGIKPEDQAYVHTYFELTKSIKASEFNEKKKLCRIDQKPHSGSHLIKKYLLDRDKTIEDFIQKDSQEMTKSDEYTGTALLLQLADFMTGLITSFCVEESKLESGNKFKKMYRKELCVLSKSKWKALVHLKKNKKSLYIPSFSNQKINVFYWRNKKPS